MKLPNNLTDNDIVVINPHHRVIYAPDPSTTDFSDPVTMSSTNQNLAGLSGVGSFQNNRQFLYGLMFVLMCSPAVFYSDIATAVSSFKSSFIL